LHGWQWLFLVEGIPSCLLGFVVLALLPDTPSQARWLSVPEKEAVAAALAREAPRQANLFAALRDARLWVLALADFGIVLGTYGLALWLPQIVSQMGYRPFATGVIVAIPYALAFVAMLLWARSSDARSERHGHAAIAALAAAGGLVIAAAFSQDMVRIAGLSLASMGIYAALATFWTLPQSFLGGTAAAAGIALVNSVGNLGGFAGPAIMGSLKQSSGGYGEGFVVLAAGLMVTAFLVLVIGRIFSLGPRTPSSAPVRGAS